MNRNRSLFKDIISSNFIDIEVDKKPNFNIANPLQDWKQQVKLGVTSALGANKFLYTNWQKPRTAVDFVNILSSKNWAEYVPYIHDGLKKRKIIFRMWHFYDVFFEDFLFSTCSS